MSWKEPGGKLSKVLSCSKLWIILPKSCPKYLDECNPNSHNCAIDMVFNTLKNLSDIISDINVSMFWIPSFKYDASKRKTEQK